MICNRSVSIQDRTYVLVLEWCKRKILLVDWWLVLELCERKILLAGWRNQTANRVKA